MKTISTGKGVTCPSVVTTHPRYPQDNLAQLSQPTAPPILPRALSRICRVRSGPVFSPTLHGKDTVPPAKCESPGGEITKPTALKEQLGLRLTQVRSSFSVSSFSLHCKAQ